MKSAWVWIGYGEIIEAQIILYHEAYTELQDGKEYRILGWDKSGNGIRLAYRRGVGRRKEHCTLSSIEIIFTT